MSENDNLKILILNTEEEYLKEFCEAYRADFCTPDGFNICCKYLESTAKHFCRGGKNGPFQVTRAYRILWAKYILMHPEERVILRDICTGNTLFFLIRTKTPHIVVCKKLGDKWNLISSFVVGGDRAKKYLKGQYPYEYFDKNKDK